MFVSLMFEQKYISFERFYSSTDFKLYKEIFEQYSNTDDIYIYSPLTTYNELKYLLIHINWHAKCNLARKREN